MIDWGTGVDGIQSPPGHRNSMLSSRTHVGLAIVDQGWTAGAYSQVQHFVSAFGFSPLVYGYLSDCSGAAVDSAQVTVYDSNGNSLGTISSDLQGAYTVQYSGGVPDHVVVTYNGNTVSSMGQAALGTDGNNFYLDLSLIHI